MYIHHIALWVTNLESQKDFYIHHFNCTASERYHNPTTGFTSYFLCFSNGVSLELMHSLSNAVSNANNQLATPHFAICVGSQSAVIELTEKCRSEGIQIEKNPRRTGDGYFESVIRDPEGNLVELTAEPEPFIQIASVADAPFILQLQKLCYLQEASLYNDYSIPPLTQTLDDTLLDFNQQLVLKIEQHGRIIGSIRAYLQDGVCYIGKLMVDPLHQNKGLGAFLLSAIEQKFTEAEKYELFTGYKSEKNIHLYKKSGYQIFRYERLSESVELVFMEKIRKSF